MKKMLLAIGLLCFAITLKAQTVNDIPLKDIDVDYVQIIGTSKLMSTQLTIELDFGQRNKFFQQKDTQVKDATGKLIVFNSMIDALNFMSANGYEFVTAYAAAVQNQSVYHYLLRKKQ